MAMAGYACLGAGGAEPYTGSYNVCASLKDLLQLLHLAGPLDAVQPGSLPSARDQEQYSILACKLLEGGHTAAQYWAHLLLSGDATQRGISAIGRFRILAMLLADLHCLDVAKAAKRVLLATDTYLHALDADPNGSGYAHAAQTFLFSPEATVGFLCDNIIHHMHKSRGRQELLNLIQFLHSEIQPLAKTSSGSSTKGFMGATSASIGGSRSTGSTSNAAMLQQNMAMWQVDAGAAGAAAIGMGSYSVLRIALAVAMRIFCMVDTTLQEQQQQLDALPPATKTAGTDGAAEGKLLQSCVRLLAARPVVPGCCGMPVCTLKPLQGCTQLATYLQEPALRAQPYFDASGPVLGAISERYLLSGKAAEASTDCAQVIEDLLQLKLRLEAAAAAGSSTGPAESDGGQTSGGNGVAAAAVPVPPGAANEAAALAARALAYLRAWQAAVLELDAWRVAQRSMAMAGADGHDTLPADRRCAFAPEDLPEAVRLVACIKGLTAFLRNSQSWLGPLLAGYGTSLLGRLMAGVVAVARGNYTWDAAESRTLGAEQADADGAGADSDAGDGRHSHPAAGNATSAAASAARMWRSKASHQCAATGHTGAEDAVEEGDDGDSCAGLPAVDEEPRSSADYLFNVRLRDLWIGGSSSNNLNANGNGAKEPKNLSPVQEAATPGTARSERSSVAASPAPAAECSPSCRPSPARGHLPALHMLRSSQQPMLSGTAEASMLSSPAGADLRYSWASQGQQPPEPDYSEAGDCSVRQSMDPAAAAQSHNNPLFLYPNAAAEQEGTVTVMCATRSSGSGIGPFAIRLDDTAAPARALGMGSSGLPEGAADERKKFKLKGLTKKLFGAFKGPKAGSQQQASGAMMGGPGADAWAPAPSRLPLELEPSGNLDNFIPSGDHHLVEEGLDFSESDGEIAAEDAGAAHLPAHYLLSPNGARLAAWAQPGNNEWHAGPQPEAELMHAAATADSAFVVVAAGDQVDRRADGGNPVAGDAAPPQAKGGMAPKKGSGFLGVVQAAATAADTEAGRRLQGLAQQLEVVLGTFGRAATGQGLRPSDAAGAAAGPAGKAGFKKFVESFKVRGGGRKSVPGLQTQGSDATQEAAGPAASVGPVSLEQVVELQMSLELMLQEVQGLLARRKAKIAAKGGPATSALKDLQAHLRAFITSCPSIAMMLHFQQMADFAADLSALVLWDPTSSMPAALSGDGAQPMVSPAFASASGSPDARGSVPWELMSKSTSLDYTMPLHVVLHSLELFRDAHRRVAAMPALGNTEQAHTADMDLQLRLQRQRLYHRQAHWAVSTFMQVSARRIWATFKAEAIRSHLHAWLEAGPEIAASTSCFDHLALHSTLELPGGAREPFLEPLVAALDELVAQSANQLVHATLQSDLMTWAALEKQVDVLGAAANRLAQHLPTRTWEEVWADAVAAPDASGGDQLMLHACSKDTMTMLETWSYNMHAHEFRPSKHTMTKRDSLFGDACSAPVSRKDAADMALVNITANTSAYFGREHVTAVHRLLGLEGVGALVAAVRQNVVDNLKGSRELLAKVSTSYANSSAGPRACPNAHAGGGAAACLQLQQRWLRDDRHKDLLVSVHRVLQGIGNGVALVALVDAALGDIGAAQARHLTPVLASVMQQDQEFVQKLQAAQQVGMGPGAVAAASLLPQPQPHQGLSLACLLLGWQVPPGLQPTGHTLLDACSIMRTRMEQELAPAQGSPRLWAALLSILGAGTLQQEAPDGAEPAHVPEPLPAGQLWALLKLHLACLTPDEHDVHARNVGEGVYVAAAGLAQLQPPSGVPDLMSGLMHAAVLEGLKQQQRPRAQEHRPSLSTLSPPQTQAAASAPATPSPAAMSAANDGPAAQLAAFAISARYVRERAAVATALTAEAGKAFRRAVATGELPTPLPEPLAPGRSRDAWLTLAEQCAANGSLTTVQLTAAFRPPPSTPTASVREPVRTPGPRRIDISQAGGAPAGGAKSPHGSAGGGATAAGDYSSRGLSRATTGGVAGPTSARAPIVSSGGGGVLPPEAPLAAGLAGSGRPPLGHASSMRVAAQVQGFLRQASAARGLSLSGGGCPDGLAQPQPVGAPSGPGPWSYNCDYAAGSISAQSRSVDGSSLAEFFDAEGEATV